MHALSTISSRAKRCPRRHLKQEKVFFIPFLEKDEIECQSNFKNYGLFIYEDITVLHYKEFHFLASRPNFVEVASTT
jgi:hypothetical protein